jgi:hypothetical protein
VGHRGRSDRPHLQAVVDSSQRVARGWFSIAENAHRYESDNGFSSDIVIDDLGLVVIYPGGWERIGMV